MRGNYRCLVNAHNCPGRKTAIKSSLLEYQRVLKHVRRSECQCNGEGGGSSAEADSSQQRGTERTTQRTPT